jgi:hypothetical protein
MNMHQLDFPSVNSVVNSVEQPEQNSVEQPVCQHCTKPFTPRKGTGGKPQRFCHSDCRSAFHAKAPTCAPHVGKVSAPAVTVPTKQTATSDASESDGDADFWIDNRADVVLRGQQATAIYRNEADALVIRQEKSWCDEYDMVICITRDNEQKFIDALCDALGIPSVP